jgi:hypothetical protein
MVTTISGNIGTRSLNDSSFWRSAGLSDKEDTDGIPDEDDEIVLGATASGTLNLLANMSVKSFKIDSGSVIQVNLGDKTLSVK